MANTVKLKRSATPSAVPTTGQLDLGEIAVNTYDGKMYIKKDNGTASIVEIGAGGGGGGSVYYKDPVRVATVVNGTLATTFANGQNIDGVTLATGDRILIKNQSTVSENGIYVVNASGAPTRASDMDANSEAQRGVVVYVQFGNVNGGSNWQIVAGNADPIVIGTNSNAWMPVQGIAGYSINSWTAPVASGANSIAFGNNAQALANSSISIGKDITTASTTYSDLRIGNTISTSSGAGGNTILGSISTTQQVSNSIVISPIGRSAGADASLFGCVVIGGNARNLMAATLSQAYGDNAYIEMSAEATWGFGIFSALGDKKISVIGCHTTTTSAAAAEIGTATNNSLASSTPTGRIVLTNDSTYLFDCDIVARNTATDTQSKVWNVKFGIRRGTSAANTALIGTPTYTVFGEDTGTSTWNVSVTADTTNGRPNISVTGEASKTIRWVANIRMTKVTG